MKPGSFDIETAKDMVGDARCRTIEFDAREAADKGRSEPSANLLRSAGATYFDHVMVEMENIVWISAHHKKNERLARLKTKVSNV